MSEKAPHLDLEAIGMKCAEQILQYVDLCIDRLVTEPRFFAPNAETLECLLREFDCLRQFIVQDSLTANEINSKSTYHAFLMKRGYGVGLISSPRKQPAWDIASDPIAKKVCESWQEYLAARKQ